MVSFSFICRSKMLNIMLVENTVFTHTMVFNINSGDVKIIGRVVDGINNVIVGGPREVTKRISRCRHMVVAENGNGNIQIRSESEFRLRNQYYLGQLNQNYIEECP